MPLVSNKNRIFASVIALMSENMTTEFNMSKYNFKIENYHAIGHADIEIDGITVIAGGNGCGKSTLSRWLYYIIQTITKYNHYLFADFCKDINLTLENLSNLTSSWDLQDAEGYADTLNKASSLISVVQDYNIENITLYYNKGIESFCNLFKKFLEEESDINSQKRTLKLLRIESAKQPIIKFKQNAIAKFEESLRKYQELKAKKDLNLIWSNITNIYREKDSHPMEIQFSEDEVQILNEKLGALFGLANALYIDTPLISSMESPRKYYWRELKHNMLYPKDGFELSEKEQKLIKAIGNMIDGSFVEDNTFGTELIFKAKSGVQVKLDKVASGFKTFAYMQRLIENGWLDNKTLLEIDEPETNLHPQWIVEFAHLLVMVNKELGTKIMIASHNPDMVSAIRYISEKEGILDKTHFYLAEQREDSELYDYKDLGNDIDPVFDSFNKSYETLQKYVEDYGNL